MNTEDTAVQTQPLSRHDAVLAELRDALKSGDILTALADGLGMEVGDFAEAIGVDERTIRRWLSGETPSRKYAKAIGELRVVAIHILQRRGLAVDSIARWLRLPDAELGFESPLAAIAEGEFRKVIVAADAYIAPRPGTGAPVDDSTPVSEPPVEQQPVADADQDVRDDQPTDPSMEAISHQPA